MERDSKESRKKVFEACKKRLKQAIAVQYYPEGTRSRLPEGKPKDFDAIKTTLIEYAYQENIPVYSCACHGTFAILQAGSISFKPFKPVGVIVNEALYPKNFTSADDFAQACWKQTLTTHKELQRKLAQQKSATFFRRAINLLR